MSDYLSTICRLPLFALTVVLLFGCSGPTDPGQLPDVGGPVDDVGTYADAGDTAFRDTGDDTALPDDTDLPDADPELPLAEIISGPAALTDNRDATFEFTCSTEDCEFECALDGEDFQTCESPLNLSDLPLGEHEFEVRAIDADTAGPATSWSWTIVDARWQTIETVDEHNCALYGEGEHRLWRSASAGHHTTHAIATDGTRHSWGANDQNQLGNNQAWNPTPTTVTDP